LEFYYDKFVKEKGMTAIIEEYKSYCITLGKDVRIETKDGVTGKVIDITEYGELIVEITDGEILKLNSGEVSVRGIYDYV